MNSDAVQRLAEDLPEHQSSRGHEFRNLNPEECNDLARWLVLARSQVQASNADFEDHLFRRSLRDKKERYMHEAGRLGMSLEETIYIWWSVVYDDLSPSERSYHV